MPTQRRTILLVDDEDTFRQTLRERMELKGYNVLEAATGEEALSIVGSQQVDCAVVDQNMPGMDGLETLSRLKVTAPDLQTILLTGHGYAKLRQATAGLDAYYFEKDDMGRFWEFLSQFKSNPGVIIIPPGAGGEGESLSAEQMELFAAGQVMDARRLQSHARAGHGRVLIGHTRAMQDLKQDISKVASLDCTVLILGETGTGKELVARTIHDQSPRNNGRFMAVNCGSFTPELLSNELFGHEKEAFTGAHTMKKGVFEAASGGTILLDEVGDTPQQMQVQLLRVLQEKTITRVGGVEEVPVDVRVLAATNRSLKDRVEKKEFRDDLYYRLNVFTIHVPPLRERRDDILPLCGFFLNKYNQAFGKKVERLDPAVVDLLMEYPFPGNVRELESIVERSVILCEGETVERRHLPQRFQAEKATGGDSAAETEELITLAELEDRYVRKVLKRLGGNRNEAAKTLGISRASLWRRLKKMEEGGRSVS